MPELMKQLDDIREAVDRLRNGMGKPEPDRRQLPDRRAKPRAASHDRRRGAPLP
jgi:hypothetical protein